MGKRLIATDFDGTFYRNRALDPADLAAVAAWRAAGGLFGFVTGRGVDFFDTAKKEGLEADFFVLYNAARLPLGGRGRVAPAGSVIRALTLRGKSGGNAGGRHCGVA